MSPTIRIWGISGPLGMLVSGLITTFLIAVGALGIQSTTPSCEGLSVGECLGAAFGNAIVQAAAFVFILGIVFLFFVIAAWFLTGLFAGWLAVRHIRRLEPGINSRQAWKVSASWGCGSIVAAVVMIVLIGILSSTLGL